MGGGDLEFWGLEVFDRYIGSPITEDEHLEVRIIFENWHIKG